jgi:thiosulfate/3-mercaptopyruvate sulfurtransferase
MLPLLIDTATLQAHLDDESLLIVDICRDENYTQGHIPGAIHISPADLIAGIPPAVGRLPDIGKLEQLFSRIGYTDTKHLVVYDDEGGGWAGRFIWTLDVIGHSSASLLDGGLIAWRAEDRPLQTEQANPQATEVTITIHQEPIAEIADILNIMQQDTAIIWDARSPEEFAGITKYAARGGHIPGAVNLDWQLLMDRENHLCLKKDLRSLLHLHGISAEKPIITHCQSHHRSGLTYFVGKYLGYSIQGYHGSWSEWGNDASTPVESM